MINLRNRDKLPAATGDELEHLVAQLRALWLVEHNEDGSHRDDPTLNLQGAPVGTFVDVAFNGVRFFAAGASVWTVADENYNYFKIGRIGQLVVVLFSVHNTEITTAASAELYISLPEIHAIPNVRIEGLALQTWVGGVLNYVDATGADSGMGSVAVQVEPTSGMPRTTIALSRLSLASAGVFGDWDISSDLTITGSVLFPCQPDNLPMPYNIT